MTKHVPPPSNKEVDCATLGGVRRGDHGFRGNDKKYADNSNGHPKSMLGTIASMMLQKRRASPSDEDNPRKRTEYLRPRHNQPEVSRGASLILNQWTPYEAFRDDARKADMVAFRPLGPM